VKVFSASGTKEISTQGTISDFASAERSLLLVLARSVVEEISIIYEPAFCFADDKFLASTKRNYWFCGQFDNQC
jgi:hypothetical protein